MLVLMLNGKESLNELLAFSNLAFKYFIFEQRNYYFTANIQTNISKLPTESAKQVSYILLKRSMTYDQG